MDQRKDSPPSFADAHNPVRNTPSGRLNSGAAMLDEEEAQEVLAVIKSRSLSRDYGPDCLDTVLRFEQGFAEKVGARYRRFREGVSDLPLRPRPVNDEEGHLGARWGLAFEDAETCARFAKALRGEGLSPGLAYGGEPVYMQPQILHRAAATPEGNPWRSPLYKGDVTYGRGLCPRSEDILRRVLLIASINPRYTERDVDDIVKAVRRAARTAL